MTSVARSIADVESRRQLIGSSSTSLQFEEISPMHLSIGLFGQANDATLVSNVVPTTTTTTTATATATATATMTTTTRNTIEVDAFDGSAEPIIYMSENKMPFAIEFNITYIYIAFAALALALLFILPGIRRARLASLAAILGLLGAVCAILLALTGSGWLLAETSLSGVPYAALTRRTFDGQLAVQVGLHWANVSLKGNLMADGHHSPGERHPAGLPPTNTSSQVQYNERFQWDGAQRMQLDHLEALQRGLPFPILSVSEFFSQQLEGFNWSFRLRKAGYYTSMVLYCALASSCLAGLSLCLLPSYLPTLMQATGAQMLLATSLYALLIRSPSDFGVRLAGGASLQFAYGQTYVNTCLVALVAIIVGFALMARQTHRPPHKRLTILDCDSYILDRKSIGGGGSQSSRLNGTEQSSLAGSLCCLKMDTPEVKLGEQLQMLEGGSQPSVMIPIEDIEQKFRSISAPAEATTTRPPNPDHHTENIYWSKQHLSFYFTK